MRTSLIRRSTAVIMLTAAMVISVSACGGDDSSGEPATTPAAPTDDTGPAGTDAPDAPDAPGTTASTDAADPAFTVPVVVYFQMDERVAPVRRQVDTMTTSTTEGTFEMWLAGPTPDEVAAGYGTTVPPGTRLLSARSENSIVTVDLSGEFASGGGTAMMLGRLAELVMTAATSAVMFDGVELLIDGEPVSVFSGEGIVIDGLLTIDDVEDQLPAIVQYRVLAGDEVATGTQISGSANTPDGAVSLQVIDTAGAVIQEATTSIGCGSECRGSFTTWIDLGDHTGPATLRLFHLSEDGSELGLVTIPFTAVS